MKRQQYQIGAVVKIPLGDETHCYGALMEEPLMVVFDHNSKTDLNMAEVSKLPILHKILVMRYAITKGYFEKVGKLDPTSEMTKKPSFWKQDPQNFKFYIVDPNYTETEVSLEECSKYEEYAVGDPHHVSERLYDHYHGLPNRWEPTIWKEEDYPSVPTT